MKKTSTTTTESVENADVRTVLREVMIAYFNGDGKDDLKILVRKIIQDELYGDSKTGEPVGDSSVATRIEIRKIVREELFPEESK